MNAMVAASKRSLDCMDRNKIKDRFDDEPDNKRVSSTINFLKKPSQYHYADMVMSYILFIICLTVLNVKAVAAYETLGIILSNAAFVFIWLAFADILPKKLAAQNGDSYAVSLNRFQRFVYVVTLPIVKLSTLFANAVLVILRKETDVDDSYFSEDRVRSMIDQGTESGELKEEAHRMIDSIFEFDDRLAYEIMTPRTDVFMIDVDDEREEYFDQLMELRYSRIPVYDGDPDNIIGILHIKDYLLKASNEGFDSINLRELLRKPYLVPETKNIDSLFVELQKEKQHIAILIDEYGGFSGIVTIEDLIEQIVGDIDDEFDEDQRVIEQIGDNVFIVDGNVYLDDLDDEAGIELESDNSETIGGYIIDLMGEIPRKDQHYKPLTDGDYRFEILSVKDRRIDKVRIEILEDDDEASEKDKYD